MIPARLRLVFGDDGGGLHSAEAAAQFEVQWTTNLVDWLRLTNALSTTNGFLWLDDDALTRLPWRFYRVLER